MAREVPRTSVAKYIVDKDPIEILQDKLMKDNSFLTQNREAEKRLRREIEDSKMKLHQTSFISNQELELKIIEIESKHKQSHGEELARIRNHYESELARLRIEHQDSITLALEEQRIQFDSLFSIKEESLLGRLSESSKIMDVLKVNLKEAQSKVSEIEKKINSERDECDDKLRRQSVNFIHEFTSQENSWKSQLEMCKADYERQIQSLQDRNSIEKSAVSVSSQAHLDAKEEELKRSYEKKIKRFEKQVIEVERSYTQKSQFLQGSLDEARRECQRLKASHAYQFDALNEELRIKDLRILAMQDRISVVDEIARSNESWKAAAAALSTKVIRACSTVTNLPKSDTVPYKDRDLLNDLLRGFGPPAERHAAVNEDIVAIDKKMITKAFLCSKKLVERATKEKPFDTSTV